MLLTNNVTTSKDSPASSSSLALQSYHKPARLHSSSKKSFLCPCQASCSTECNFEATQVCTINDDLPSIKSKQARCRRAKLLWSDTKHKQVFRTRTNGVDSRKSSTSFILRKYVDTCFGLIEMCLRCHYHYARSTVVRASTDSANNSHLIWRGGSWCILPDSREGKHRRSLIQDQPE